MSSLLSSLKTLEYRDMVSPFKLLKRYNALCLFKRLLGSQKTETRNMLEN